MIRIKDKYTGKEFKCWAASKEFALNDSFCTDYVGSRWLANWHAVILYKIQLGTRSNKASFQILLKDRYEVVL